MNKIKLFTLVLVVVGATNVFAAQTPIDITKELYTYKINQFEQLLPPESGCEILNRYFVANIIKHPVKGQCTIEFYRYSVDPGDMPKKNPRVTLKFGKNTYQYAQVFVGFAIASTSYHAVYYFKKINNDWKIKNVAMENFSTLSGSDCHFEIFGDDFSKTDELALPEECR